MKYKLDIKTIQYLIIFCSLGLSMLACNNTLEKESNIESSQPVPYTNTAVDTSFLAPQYLTAESIAILNEIKVAFDLGISKGYGDRLPAYVYEQHALRMRMDYFDDAPYTSVFPYNGTFDLSQFQEVITKLPFISNKCGLQVLTTNEIVNYYCLNTNPAFMQYLAAVGEGSILIKNFQQRYQQIKSIDRDMRQAMLTKAVENINFSNLDHQYFYLLFHLFVNEERLAMEKVESQAK